MPYSKHSCIWMYSLRLKILCRYLWYSAPSLSSSVIALCFSTVDSASPDVCPLSARHSEPNPTQNNILSFKQAPESYWENVCVCAEGGVERGVYWWSLFTRNESKSEPQWEEPQRCRIFLNEITPSPPYTLPHQQRWHLIGRASQPLTSDRLSCGWVRAQEHPFCLR